MGDSACRPTDTDSKRECAAAAIPLFLLRGAFFPATSEPRPECFSRTPYATGDDGSDDWMSAALPDEYQDGTSAGSLVIARRCWRDLVAANMLQAPQHFTFAFHCPTERMAVGLMDYLRYTSYAGYVRSTNGIAMAAVERWQVTGTTHDTVWSLSSLEHLFMDLRRAGARYESALVTLDLVTASRLAP